MDAVGGMEVPSGAYFLVETGLRTATGAEGFNQVTMSKEASDHALVARLLDLFLEIVGA